MDRPVRRKKRSFFWKVKKVFSNIGRMLKEALRRFLRYCYFLGVKKLILIGAGVIAVLVTLAIVISASSNKEEELQLEHAVVTESVTTVSTAAEPSEATQPTWIDRTESEPETMPVSETPAPTPEIRYEKGSEGEDVQAIQIRLMELGYLEIDEPTSHFGSVTKEAVKIFQRQHELQQDGIIGNDTYLLLMSDNAQKYVMKEGAQGNDIEDFQDKLCELGYLESNQCTGYYGTDTVQAVTKFQKRNKLKQDGKAGEKTMEMINSADARVSYTKELEIEEAKKKAEKEAAKKTVEGRIANLISIAKSQLGKPYILGKKGPDSFDCSGLVYYCLNKADVYCRRLDASGYSRNSSWTKIDSMDSIKKGDLLFFRSAESSSVGHVGIYIGSGEMIDASSGNGKVVRRSCKTEYWRKNFVCARRPIG